MPDAAGDLCEEYPDVWKAYAALGKSTADCGPQTPRERRLVKLALAIGAGSEGEVHSHTRRARSEGIEPAAIGQVAMLAIGPLGLPRAVAARIWIEDIKE
jgi:alkylhydroperoxidase/carboxymuconolactone decarboxylase family protein YurZ